ncbi:MAG: S9 family peptidase [Rikenellaceae bacterium]|nr:S9 family peptidase [Rikenellaceae bacterium]
MENSAILNPLTENERGAARLTPEVMWKMARVGGFDLSPDGTETVYALTSYDVAANRGTTCLWRASTEGADPVRLTEGNSPAWLADGTIVFLSDRSGSSQIWRVGPEGKNPTQLSAVDGDVESFGVASNGNVWIAKKVAVEKRLSSDVYDDMPKSKGRIYDDLMARHWNYWDEGSYQHLFVGRIEGGTIKNLVDIMHGEPWDAPMAPYFDGSEVAWNNAGTQLAYTCKKLAGTAYAVSTDSDIYLYDVASGATRNLTEGMVGYDKYPRFSPDDSRVAFSSMARAGNESDKARLFTVDLATGVKNYLTSEFDYNATDLTWDADGRIYFIAPIEATEQFCRINPDGGAVERLTEGDHDVVGYARKGAVTVLAVQSISSPTELYNGDRLLTIHNSEIREEIRMGRVEKRWVATTDNKRMLTWVVYPPDFDPAKKYPTLLYCQGGPQDAVSQFWSYRWNFQLMAAQGYVVVAPNRRGVPSFGQEWLDQISGDYSGQNIRDYLSAIDDVAREPWCDRDRLGCVGASYGGYSVFFLAGNHDRRFKAFIAHCGIFDFESMYGQTEELFFVNNDYGGPYWETKNAVAQRSYANSPHKFVARWDTPILIFTGEKDYRIPYVQSLEAFTAARVRGVPARLVVFENEAHQVFKPQNSMVWNREFFGWLDKYLK